MTSTSSRRRAATLAAGVVLALPVSSLLLSGTAYAEGATNTDPNPYAATASTGDNQGNGSAPANGTVGKADDMNPAGQAPGGSDANNGYECDNNNGVGDNGGNPAHTGCTTPTAPTSSTSDSSTAVLLPAAPTATALPFTGDRTGTQVELGLLMLAVGVGAVVVGRRTV
ncbi:MAG: hypothetical protein LC779_15380 [Actinobacteria bacterium]|nr:hypothetical protein [Actinomycetota bacterium]